jgi:nucleotide-binding universal stress UspA family protein
MFSTVAVGTDGSATASEAVNAAVQLARSFDAKLVLVSAFQDEKRTPADRRQERAELQWVYSPGARLKEILARTQEEVEAEGIECSTVVDKGDPAEVLVRLVEQSGADLLVIGNKGMHRRLLGSVPNTVSHNAPCSVLIVKTT